MKLHLILLVVLAFAAGMFAGEKKKAFYYRLDPVDSNTLLVTCTEDRPFTTMRLDDVLEVHCHTPKH